MDRRVIVSVACISLDFEASFQPLPTAPIQGVRRAPNPQQKPLRAPTTSARAPHQRAATVTHPVVHALDRASAAVPLLADTMLPLPEEIRVRPVPVRVHQPLLEPLGQSVPQSVHPLVLAASHHHRQNLARVPRTGYPQPLRLLEVHAYLVDLDRVRLQVDEVGGVDSDDRFFKML
jgi:hypothetical protein